MAAEMVDDGEMGGGLSRGVLLGQREKEPQKKNIKRRKAAWVLFRRSKFKTPKQGFLSIFQGREAAAPFFF
jgi:hypothetical protein